MTTTRTLARRVAVDGRWYGPGPVPDDIAEKITNPKAWDADAPDTVDAPDTAPGTSAGAVLARRVAVNGRWYGPSDTIPDDVARRITNPKAWEGGVLPGAEATVATSTPQTGQEDGQPEPPPPPPAAAKKAVSKKG